MKNTGIVEGWKDGGKKSLPASLWQREETGKKDGRKVDARRDETSGNDGRMAKASRSVLSEST
jgi:hypothetical protein